MERLLLIMETARASFVELRTRAEADQRGESGIPWLLVILASIAIVGTIVAAVMKYVGKRNGELGA